MSKLAALTRLKSSKWLGYGFAALGSFLFATKGIFIKLTYALGLDATELMALRLALAAPIYAAIGALAYRSRLKAIAQGEAKRLSAKQWVSVLGVGLLGYWFASFTDFMSLKTLSPQFERLIIFTYPLFVILIGAFFFKHRFKVFSLWAFALSYGGLMLVFWHDYQQDGQAILVGTLWCLASSIAFAFYLLLAKPLIAQLGASLFTSLSMLSAGAGTWVHYLILHPNSAIPLNPDIIALGLGLAIAATVLPSFLISNALSRISSQANAVIGFVNPIITLALSAFILRENLSLYDLLGAVLVLGGVGFYTYLDQRSSKT